MTNHSSANSGAGWALVRADGAVAAVDGRFSALLGAASAADLVGRSWRDLATPRGQQALADIEESARQGRRWSGVIEFQRPDGPRTFEVDAEPSASERGVALHLREIVDEVIEPAAGAATTELKTRSEAQPEAQPQPPTPTLEEPERQLAPEPLVVSVDETAIEVEVAPEPASEPAAELEPERAHVEPPEPPEAPPAPPGSPRDILAEAAADVSFDWAAVLRRDGAGAFVVAAYPQGMAGVDEGARWAAFDAAERTVLETGEPSLDPALAVHRGDSSPLARLPAFGMRSAVRLPLFRNGEIAGLVFAASSKASAFGIDDALRLERIVRRLGAMLGDGAEEAPARPQPPSTPQRSIPARPEQSSTAPSAERLAEQFDRLGALSEVMGGVAHELNNPLTAVVGYAQALRSLPLADRDRALDTIAREALRAGRIVRNLLTFAQRHPPRLTAVDLNAVVRRVLDFRHYALQVDNIELDLDLQPLPHLPGDEHQLEQAVLNIVNNAHQAMEDTGGTLRVRTSAAGDRVRLVIEDSGPGVPSELATRIFDPFFTTRGVGGGMGLGLAIVFGTVTAHGGRVWVEPGSSGGARFTVELPLAPEPVPPPEEPTPQPAAEWPTAGKPESASGTATRRILVVDDEESIRALALQVLPAFGYEGAAAATAEEALALLGAQRFDAVLTDIRMPGMDGIELHRRIAERWPLLARRVLIMTGDVANEAVADLVRDYELRSLEKPFRLEQLRQALKDTLERA